MGSTKVIDGSVRMTVPSDPKFLPIIRAIADEGAAIVGFQEEDRHNIVLAVTEALTNVIRHAYQGDNGKRIDLVLLTERDRFHLEIIDYGEFVDPSRIESRPLDEVRPGGLGVYLMKTTMDDVAYTKNTHGGTTLTMVKSPNTKESTS